MPDFQFLIVDDRYSVPSLCLVQAEDARAARIRARRLVAEPHHLAVEVWRADRRLFTVARPAT